MKLYYFPLSTYSQKTLIALYEKGVKFTPELVDLQTPEGKAAYKKVYPLGKIPVLVDGDNFIPESSIIIEYVDGLVDSGPRLIPQDRDLGRKTRFQDRMADLYINNQFQTIFFEGFKPEAQRSAQVIERAKETIDIAYRFLDRQLTKKTWVMGDDFTLADCALAPPLGYLRSVHPFDAHANLAAYWGRLAERPSVRRVLDEAKPYLSKIGM